MKVGTIGWVLSLDDVLVCLSNWHVFCGRGNDSEIGQRCYINYHDIASLYTYQKISNRNYWDYALAKLDEQDPSKVDVSMQICSDSSQYPYPTQLTATSDVKFGMDCHKVGYRTGCTHGKLLSVADVAVEEEGWFTNQLIFENISDHGDSGSTIIRSDDNSVLGLLFAGDGQNTVANPIYLAQWHLLGWRLAKNNATIPMFSGSPLLSDYGVSGLESSSQVRTRRQELSTNFPALLRDRVPNLSGRYSVLGFGRGPAGSNAQIPSGPAGTIRTEELGNCCVRNPTSFGMVYIHLGRKNDPSGKKIRDVTVGTDNLLGDPIPSGFASDDNGCEYANAVSGWGLVVRISITLTNLDDDAGSYCYGVGEVPPPPPAGAEAMQIIRLATYDREPPQGGQSVPYSWYITYGK